MCSAIFTAKAGDLTITHEEHFVVQATDYGVWGDVIREQKSDIASYRYGYQGQFAEKDDETGWNHFELREYDAVIGRWLITDPYGQYWSPYLGMGNDPTNGVDPDGGWCCGSGKDMAYADAMIQEDINLYDYVQLSDVTTLREVEIVGQVDTWFHFVEFLRDREPNLAINFLLKQSKEQGNVKVTVPAGLSVNLSPDGFDTEPVTPESSYIALKRGDIVEMRLYLTAEGKAPGEDGQGRLLVTLGKGEILQGRAKAQLDVQFHRNGKVYVGARAVGEWELAPSGTTVEVSINYRQRAMPFPKLWTLLHYPGGTIR